MLRGEEKKYCPFRLPEKIAPWALRRVTSVDLGSKDSGEARASSDKEPRP
jgi:hypothetical protein